MFGDRGIALLADPDQWARCAHHSTALLDGGGIELTWEDDPSEGTSPGEPAGLAFDRWCRAYRSWPGAGRVEILDGAASGAADRPGALRAPRGLAVDSAQRLYVAESGGGAVHVVDLRAQRLLRRVPVRSARHRARWPADVAAACCGAVVLLRRPDGLAVIEGRRGPRPGPDLRRPAGAGKARPVRLTARNGVTLVLWAGNGTQAMIAEPGGGIVVSVPGATDLDLVADDLLVVARRPGQGFRRFRRVGAGWVEIEPLAAPGYDGGAVTTAPDGRIAFTTPSGLGWTAGSNARHALSGRVVTYRLDAGDHRTRWGRLFMDACVPPGTGVRVGFLTSDDDKVPDPIAWTPADRGAGPVASPEYTPPLPSETELRELPPPAAVFRRPAGTELPWPRSDDTGYQTYEAPVAAAPGRYLWVVVELTGTARSTPRVAALRIERPGHRLANRLPRSWTRHDADAAFLSRYLGPAEGLLHELDERAALRAVLLDPAATPGEALEWLGSLLGLVFDRRWPEASRRALLAQAFDLFRIRGTRAGLERMLGLYLDRPVAVVENWRLRGLGGAVLGTGPDGEPAPAVLGAARTGGALGHFTVGGALPGSDGYQATAHRFSVLITTELTAERRDVVRRIVEDHKPAHTVGQICELGTGMRVGRRLHLDLTSVVGPDSGWGQIVVGQVPLGGDGIVGRPSAAARVGETAGVGAVRVG
jgi:phage tail-like protein